MWLVVFFLGVSCCGSVWRVVVLSFLCVFVLPVGAFCCCPLGVLACCHVGLCRCCPLDVLSCWRVCFLVVL